MMTTPFQGSGLAKANLGANLEQLFGPLSPAQLTWQAQPNTARIPLPAIWTIV